MSSMWLMCPNRTQTIGGYLNSEQSTTPRDQTCVTPLTTWLHGSRDSIWWDSDWTSLTHHFTSMVHMPANSLLLFLIFSSLHLNCICILHFFSFQSHPLVRHETEPNLQHKTNRELPSPYQHPKGCPSWDGSWIVRSCSQDIQARTSIFFRNVS